MRRRWWWWWCVCVCVCVPACGSVGGRVRVRVHVRMCARVCTPLSHTHTQPHTNTHTLSLSLPHTPMHARTWVPPALHLSTDQPVKISHVGHAANVDSEWAQSVSSATSSFGLKNKRSLEIHVCVLIASPPPVAHFLCIPLFRNVMLIVYQLCGSTGSGSSGLCAPLSHGVLVHK